MSENNRIILECLQNLIKLNPYTDVVKVVFPGYGDTVFYRTEYGKDTWITTAQLSEITKEL